MRIGMKVMCRHDASLDRKYTDAGQLLRMACNDLIGNVESVHVDETHGPCYKIRFEERRGGHSCAFYDSTELAIIGPDPEAIEPRTSCECKSVSFDEKLARAMTPDEIRRAWPRFDGTCPCGFMGISYHSMMHLIAGDW